MLSKTILAASALLSMAAAVPMQQQNKRDTVWTTKVEEEVVTVDVTKTVWLNPGETPPSHHYPGHNHGHQHHHHKVTSHIQTTVTVPAASSAAPVAGSSQPAYSAPSPSSAPAQASSYVAPTSQAPAPTSSVAPAYSSQAPAPPPSSGGGSAGAPSGQTYTGDITHYAVGLGSCGYTNTNSEAVVAIAEGMMAPGNGINPNKNPWCGKMITISYAGKQTQAKIVDTCGGCARGSIDLSPTLFKTVAPNGDGRVHGVKWWFD